MLERTFNAERFDAVMRHPSVFPQVSLGMSELPSASDLVANISNVCLMNEHGGFLFRQFSPGQFDVHTIFLPEGRGRKALHAALEAKRIMFEDFHAHRLVTFVPFGNEPAKRLAEAVGFTADFESDCMGVPGMTFKLEATCQ